MLLFVFFFFFQAEDGIRDLTVTGVQTCALPILDHQDADELLPRVDPVGRAVGSTPRIAAERAVRTGHPDVCDDGEAEPEADPGPQGRWRQIARRARRHQLHGLGRDDSNTVELATVASICRKRA